MRVLLICSSGASSGFLVQNMKKSALAKGLEIEIQAKSEYDVENYIDVIDLLLVGPHLKYLEESLNELGAEYKVPVQFISQEIYGTLDGDGAIKIVEHYMEEKSHE